MVLRLMKRPQRSFPLTNLINRKHRPVRHPPSPMPLLTLLRLSPRTSRHLIQLWRPRSLRLLPLSHKPKPLRPLMLRKKPKLPSPRLTQLLKLLNL